MWFNASIDWFLFVGFVMTLIAGWYNGSSALHLTWLFCFLLTFLLFAYMKVASSTLLPDYFVPVMLAILVALISIFMIDHFNLIKTSSGNEIFIHIGQGKVSDAEAAAFQFA